MKALLIKPGVPPEPIEYEGLKGLQELVGGYIEPAGWVFDDAPALYVNEEGKMNGSLPNRAVYAPKEWDGAELMDGAKCREGQVLEILFGDIVAVGFDPETGESRDITDEEIARVIERFSGSVEADNSGAAEYLRIKLNLAR